MLVSLWVVGNQERRGSCKNVSLWPTYRYLVNNKGEFFLLDRALEGSVAVEEGAGLKTFVREALDVWERG